MTSPPITTEANGRCISAPSPVDSAMGRNPKLATSADPQHKILANLTLIPATERHRLG